MKTLNLTLNPCDHYPASLIPLPRSQVDQLRKLLEIPASYHPDADSLLHRAAAVVHISRWWEWEHATSLDRALVDAPGILVPGICAGLLAGGIIPVFAVNEKLVPLP